MPNARIAIASFFALACAIPAAAAGPEYSADAVETRPGLGNHAGRLYVRGTSRRYEHQLMGLPVVEIDLPEQGIRRVVFPLTRSYIEQPTADLPGNAAAQQPSDAPCKDSPALACKRTGTAEIAGLATEVWSVRPTGAPADSTIHWDPKRRIAVREQHVDGRRLEATKLGAETYEGRSVEHWRIAYLMPGGLALEGRALVDPELGATIAERRPDGASRRLVNLTPGGVDDRLFQVPEGYRRMPGPGQVPETGPGARPGDMPPANRLQPQQGVAPSPPVQSGAAAKPATDELPAPPATVTAPPQSGATKPAPPAIKPTPLRLEPQTTPQTSPPAERRAASEPPPGAGAAGAPPAATAEIPVAGEIPAPVRKPDTASSIVSAASMTPSAATASALPGDIPAPVRKPEIPSRIVTGTAATPSAIPVAPPKPKPGSVAKPAGNGGGARTSSGRTRSARRTDDSSTSSNNPKRRRKAR